MVKLERLETHAYWRGTARAMWNWARLPTEGIGGCAAVGAGMSQWVEGGSRRCFFLN